MRPHAAQLLLLLACLSVVTFRALGSQQAHHAGKLDATASSFVTGKDKAKSQQYGEDSYGYDKGYDEWCDDGCPNPQIADDVRDAYFKHYTFDWSALAAEYATEERRTADGSKQEAPLKQHNTVMDETTVQNKKKTQAPAMPTPARQLVSKSTAGQQDLASVASTGTGQSVHTAAVTYPGFLAPVGPTESAVGFEGASDSVVPPDQALAIGPHPTEPGVVLVMHGINRVWEVFPATEGGERLSSGVKTKLGMQFLMSKMGASPKLYGQDPQAFFDRSKGRYVLAWTSVYFEEIDTSVDTSDKPSLFVCVSATDNPLASWTCWMLDAIAGPQPYVEFCTGPITGIYPISMMASYSDDGIFVSLVQVCTEDDGLLTTLYAFSKEVLYSTPQEEDTPVVYRATYLPSSSWMRSLPAKDQLAALPPDYDYVNGFNTYVQPSRPQDLKDIPHPVFVIGKVDGNKYMSIAKLTKEPLEEMTSALTAPKIYAALIDKELDFSQTPGFPRGNSSIFQPGDSPILSAGTVGRFGKSYGAVHSNGLAYIATTEFYGANETRVPSIYWAIVDPSHKLCKPSVEKYGMVASKDGLALAYPVIAAGGQEGSAMLAYVYGGSGDITLGGASYPAYAGVATSVVGLYGESPRINVVKRGERVINREKFVEDNRLPYGFDSAIEFVGGNAWFAVDVALDNENEYGSWISMWEL